MKTSFRLFLMFFCFILEVKVHALDLGKNCSEPGHCYFFTRNFEVKSVGSTEYRFKKSTTMKQASAKKAEVVAGQFLVDTKTDLQIKTLYGEVLLYKSKAIIEVDNKRTRIYALSKGVYYRGRGQSGATELDPTFYVDMGRVTKLGIADVRFPHSTAKKDLIAKWSGYYKTGERRRFLASTKNITKNTLLGPHELSHTYLMTARREQEGLDQRRAAEARRKAKFLEETQYLRDLFRRKNYLNY